MPPPGSRVGAASRRSPLPAILLAGVVSLAAAPAAPRGLVWPLGVPGTLLSSFGEYRYDHLPAGIDIGTAGATGHKVLAADAGAVYRMKVEWRGYGRALYVRHAGGRVTVYGHLERFEDVVLGLERRVARRQAEAGTLYPGDILLDPPVRVRRGQVIAYSGESGVGLPHLHFEVRDAGDAPIDPFAAGLPRPPDRRAPVLESLTITAAAADVFIDGSGRERTYPLALRDGVAVTREPIRVSGPFVPAITAHDPAGAGGRAGVRSVRMSVDGAARFAFSIPRFRFRQYPQSGLVFDHRGSHLGPARFTYRLVRLPGNDFATGPGGAEGPAPSVDLPEGSHRMEVVVEDSAGNRRRASVCVLVGKAPPPRVEPLPGSLRVSFATDDPPGGRQARGCALPPDRIEAELWGSGGFTPLPCRPAPGGTCAVALPADGPAIVRLRAVRHGVPGRWEIVDSGSGPAPAGDFQLDAWPSFFDLFAPLSAPGIPDLSVTCREDGSVVAPFLYRDGAGAVAGVDYARAAPAAPLALGGAPPSGARAPLPDVRLLRPGEAHTYQGPGFAIEFPAGARFSPGPLMVRSERIAGPEGLPAASEAIDLLPDGEALDERAVLFFDVDPDSVDPRALGIYRWIEHRGLWAFEDDDYDAARRALSLRFRRYGRFALLHDATPPRVLEVAPRDGARGIARRPRLQAAVEEIGEGIEADGVAFVLDGVALRSEFDPDRDRARALDVPALSPGEHHLRVTARDRAGNASDPYEVRFTVR